MVLSAFPRLLTLALLAALALGGSRVALAGPPAAPLSEADEDRLLQTSTARAKEQLSLGNPAEALKILAQAYERVPTPALLWPIAELHLRLGQLKGARAALDKYVAQVPPTKMPKGQQLSDVDRLREALARQFGRLQLDSLSPGSSVSIDGEAVEPAQTTKPIELDPGPHRIEAREGGRQVVREIRLVPGQELRLNLRSTDSAGLDIELLPRPRRARPVRTAAWVLGGIGIAGIIAGGVLWGTDGLQSCPQAPMCRFALDSKSTGIGLFSAGVGLSGAALVLGIIDYRNSRSH